MNIHPQSPLSKSKIKRLATSNGLSQIDFKQKYTLTKLGAKNKSSLGYPDRMVAIDSGEAFLVGAEQNEKEYIWIVLFGNNDDWFKTSPILSCLKTDKNSYLIETENSYYELVPKLKNLIRPILKKAKKLLKKRKKSHPLYYTWTNMLRRCYDIKFTKYPIYGGRGITVCERWKDFNRFVEDMGIKPSKEHSLDRIDPNGNYEPSNCRWADRLTQRLNQSKKRYNVTGYTGVKKQGNRFVSQIVKNNKKIYLGTYDSPEEAAKAYDNKAKELYKENANLNFPECND